LQRADTELDIGSARRDVAIDEAQPSALGQRRYGIRSGKGRGLIEILARGLLLPRRRSRLKALEDIPKALRLGLLHSYSFQQESHRIRQYERWANPSSFP
jgi:hypothetical protein